MHLGIFLDFLRFANILIRASTAWCSEIGSLRSLDAPELHASSDVREPISQHQSVLAMHRLLSVNSLTNQSTLLCRNPVSITRSFLLTQTPKRCTIDKIAVSLELAHSCQAVV